MAAASKKKPARPSGKKPKLPPHGSRARYRGTKTRKGCRCKKCKAAEKAHQLAYRTKQREKRQKGKGRPRLNVAQQSLRDTHMLTRHIQGFSYEEIAAEVGLSAKAVGEAVRKKRAAQEPITDLDPTKVVEGMVLQIQVSIGDLEKLAAAAIEIEQYAWAIGAKNAANAARRDLTELLQTAGVLPHDLGVIRHQVELQTVVAFIYDSVESLEEKVKSMDLSKEQRKQLMGATSDVRGSLKEAAGAAEANDEED